MVGVSCYTVAEYLRRAGVVGITWPIPAELDDAALERRLFQPAPCRRRAGPAAVWLAAHTRRVAVSPHGSAQA